METIEALTGITVDWKQMHSMPKKETPKVLFLSKKNGNYNKVTDYLFRRGIDYELMVYNGTIVFTVAIELSRLNEKEP